MGAFPTFRCLDGSAFDPDAPCPEMTDLPEWLAAEMGTEYTRMRSRQAFVHGAAFHLTGNERYLAWMRAGVVRLRANAYKPDTGSAVSWWRDGVPGPEVGARTAQDLAYAELGRGIWRRARSRTTGGRLMERVIFTYVTAHYFSS